MESLLAMGILTAYGYSVAMAFAGGNHVYFDTACAIVTLVLAGKTIERGAKEKTARAVTLLYRLMPNKARLLVEGRERFVSLEALQPGAVFRVKSGERIPADGMVVEGRSHADESVLTGESAPRPKAPGDAVVCGSMNTGGVLEIRATRVGADSTLAQHRPHGGAGGGQPHARRALGGPRRPPLHSRRAGACRRSPSPDGCARTGRPRRSADARHRRAGDRLPLRARHRHPAGAHRRRGRRRRAAASW